MSFQKKTLIFAFALTGLASMHTAVYADDIYVNIFDHSYVGSFDGKDTFRYEDSEQSFTMTGTWKNNVPSGDMTITYENEKTITADYVDGIMNGAVLVTAPDQTTTAYTCVEGIPAGLVEYANAAGTVSGYDYYYQGQLISSLIDKCEEVNYHRLFSPSYYPVLPVKISGTVMEILDTQQSELLILQDTSKHLYAALFSNLETDSFNQGLLPNLSTGETVTVFSFFQSVSDLISFFDKEELTMSEIWGTRELVSSNSSFSSVAEMLQDGLLPRNLTAIKQYYLESASQVTKSIDLPDFSISVSLPVLLPFYAETEESPTLDRMSLQYSYEELLKYPYSYCGMSAALTGEVVRANIDYQNEDILFTVRTSEGKNTWHDYIVHYDFRDDAEASPDNLLVPVTGDTVTVTGTYNGNAKLLSFSDQSGSEKKLLPVYTLFPAVEATSFTID